MADVTLRKYYTSFSDIWTDINSLIVSAGWTLYDNVSSSNKVYRSNGEEGIFPYIYVRIYYSSTTVYIELYLYWDIGTHTGTTKAYSSYNSLSFDTTTPIWCHFIGNEDILGFFTGYSTTNDMIFLGFCNKLFYPDITNLTSSASSGDNVNLEVASSSGIVKGQRVQIVGVDTEGRDQLQVTDVPDSTHVTVLNLPRDYASGAFLGVTPCPALISKSNYNYTGYLLCYRDAVGDEDGTSNDEFRAYSPIENDYIDPDSSSYYYLLVPPYFVFYSYDSLVGYIDCDLLKMCPESNQDDVFAINSAGTPEQGTVTSATSNTITDSTKNWTINEFANKHVVIIDGTGVKESSVISSNTSDTLTLSSSWVNTPDATSVYRIADTIYRHSSSSTQYWVFLEKNNTV